jgi:DNA-binding response OmpR family regulator
VLTLADRPVALAPDATEHEPLPLPRLRLIASAATTPARRQYCGHVLIVAADVAGRTGLANFLRHRGLRVWVAGTAADALAMIAHCTPDLMLLSLDLPTLGSFDLIRTVRGQRATAALPIVVLTAGAQAREIRLALALGADDYLAAPLELSLVEACIMAWLRRQARARLHVLAPEWESGFLAPSMNE